MSTINDALRRAQKELEEKNNPSIQNKKISEPEKKVEENKYPETIESTSMIDQAIQKQKTKQIQTAPSETKEKVNLKISKNKNKNKKFKKKYFFWLIIFPTLFIGTFFVFHHFSLFKKINFSLIHYLNFTHKKPPKKVYAPIKNKQKILAAQRAIEMHYLKSLIVDGTLVMGNKRAAIINHTTYYPEDLIHGNRIVEISPNAVKIDNHGETVTLKIQE